MKSKWSVQCNLLISYFRKKLLSKAIGTYFFRGVIESINFKVNKVKLGTEINKWKHLGKIYQMLTYFYQQSRC